MSQHFVKDTKPIICSVIDFKPDFVWGVSTSALQTEGAFDIDGKESSIWDAFATKKNVIFNNDSPSVACDFYHRFEEDINIIKQLGIPNFRFSLSWPRILPKGTGIINQAGIDFYHRVIDHCLKSGIEPWITIYHWDLPLELEKNGGWTNREILHWFEEFVQVCITSFGSKVKNWMILNEPIVFTGAGYFVGMHAPGKKGISNFLAALHHANLCQGIGLRTIKQHYPNARVGTTFSCSHITSFTEREKDKLASNRIHTLLNRLAIEPLLGLGYPINDLPTLGNIKKWIKQGDETAIKAEFDFIGIQVYTREVVTHSMFIPYLKAKLVPAAKRKVYHTKMGWEIYPKALQNMIEHFAAYEAVKEIFITENGASFADEVTDGIVDDQQRIDYLKTYIEKLCKIVSETPKVKGYFVWSLTDNFEWNEGYNQRFGLVYIDFASQQRIIKNSGFWYSNFIKNHPVPIV